MARRFDLVLGLDPMIGDASFSFARKHGAIAAEAALDGVYVARATVPEQSLDDVTTVAAQKSLAQVERAFRCLKTIDLHVRPIHHLPHAVAWFGLAGALAVVFAAFAGARLKRA